MDQQVGWLKEKQGPMGQPFDQLDSSRRLEHRLEGVPGARRSQVLGTAQQVQIVIAEHGLKALTQLLFEIDRPLQNFERSRSAIDEIADQPETVSLAVEVAADEKLTQGLVATVNVADDVGGQWVRSRVSRRLPGR